MGSGEQTDLIRLKAEKPALLLAPMDSVTDAPMRALQGETGAFTFAVSEFIRVSANAVPVKVFHREVPELLEGGVTRSGLPVQVQILGGNLELMAESALNAVEAGTQAIDINFGCPAPTVNRNDGGATILQYPHRIYDIVKAVRSAVPRSIPVSAKIRLGWESVDEVDEIACQVERAGADWLVIHARTKLQKYRPPVFWDRVGRVNRRLSIPVVANGDVWTLEDFRRCREETGCEHFMLGRGALARPGLACQIAKELGLLAPEAVVETDWVKLLRRLSWYAGQQSRNRRDKTFHRLKQWLNMARTFGDFPHFDQVKKCGSEDEFFTLLERLLKQDAALPLEI